jgi:hypothetical protein
MQSELTQTGAQELKDRRRCLGISYVVLRIERLVNLVRMFQLKEDIVVRNTIGTSSQEMA